MPKVAIALVSAVTAGAVVITSLCLNNDRDSAADALTELSHRPTVARLSGERRYRGYARTFSPTVLWDVEKDLHEHPLPNHLDQLHTLGVTRLVAGDRTGAVKCLIEAVALAEATPVGPVHRAAILNDLAAAHFEFGSTGNPQSLIIGLDSAEKAWALDRTPAIAWTRAVLLSSLASEDAASNAWDDYFALDSTSTWAAEAKGRRKPLRPRVETSGTTATLDAIHIGRSLDVGSKAIEQYDRTLGELINAGDTDRAVALLLLRAKTLDGMRASDEAWADLLRARMLISGRMATAERVIEALAVAAARDGYPYAARALFADAMTAAADDETRARLTRWQVFLQAHLEWPSIVHLVEGPHHFPSRARFLSEERGGIIVSIAGAATWGDSSVSVRELAHAEAVAAMAAENVQTIYEREARIEIANGSPAAALWMSDRARTAGVPLRNSPPCASNLESTSAEALGQGLARCVPAGVTLVHQDLDEESLNTWVIRGGSIVFTTAPVSAPRLLAEIERFRGDIQGEADEAVLREQARHLYDVLLRPVERQIGGTDLLVYSPSRNLRELPVGALHDHNGFLVQRRRIITAATISSFELPGMVARAASALVMLPPAAPRVKELTGARREVREVSAMYGSRALCLTGNAATPEAFLGSAAYYDILHVSTHGYASDLPYQNAIDFGSRRIRAYDVLGLRLDRAPVVMLAACRTAEEGGGPTNISLANAFLAAGASAVVGSLWNVEDAETADLSADFHRELARGLAPQDALRNVQLQLIRRAMPIRSWAAFQVGS